MRRRRRSHSARSSRAWARSKGQCSSTGSAFFPEISQKVWEEGAPWLTPHFLDFETNIVNSAIQTWLLRSEGRTILVDTGVGNHKERPYAPVWSHLKTDFLANLARAGVAPEDVDIVINTHLHVDHVGGNTCLDGRQWVPTFPNATYLMPKDDFDFWNPANGHKPLLGRGNQNVFEDSVAPVHQAGRTLLWENSHQIDADLRLEAAPGHTPGSSVLTLTSGTDRAVFVGDMLHSPVQIHEPDANSCFCEDLAGARATRRKVLGRATDNNALVIPAHLGGHGAAEVVREGGGFAIKGWAPFTPYTEQG
ncbi:MBL fold metallo-hydrolase [Streptomyces shenzhenensis]|uniref:MBL fold metallo-hydrolase n=1 Tax=Streptomyces shenzhenensis TaxID=943815 RepID=UPI003D91FD00